MNRRGFLQSCIALAAAPMIGDAKILMPVRNIIVPGGTVLTDLLLPPGWDQFGHLMYHTDSILLDPAGRPIEWKESNGGPSMWPGKPGDALWVLDVSHPGRP